MTARIGARGCTAHAWVSLAHAPSRPDARRSGDRCNACACGVLGANSRGRVVHVLLFGIGSMIGMGVPSCVIALPIAISAR